MAKLPGTYFSTIGSQAHSTRTESFIRYAIKNWTRITSMVLITKVKNSPLVQGSLGIPVSIKLEWEIETNLDRLKTILSNSAYSLKDAHVDDSKETIVQILKYNSAKAQVMMMKLWNALSLKKTQKQLNE